MITNERGIGMSNNSVEWLGKVFGRLTVIGFVHAEKPERGWWWKCRCECGETKVFRPNDVKRGRTQSCGCFHDEVCQLRAIKFEHRVKDHKRLYSIYNWIKRRCYDETCLRFMDYGGRGIQMCAEWLNENEGFDSFVTWSLRNGYSENLTIDRIDVNGDYSPGNCRWLTHREQNLNKRDTLWVDFKGERITLKELCEREGVTYDTVHNRIYVLGWSVEKAVQTPSERATSLAKKCREQGLNYGTVRSRIYTFGWDEERALNTPTVGRGAHKNTYG